MLFGKANGMVMWSEQCSGCQSSLIVHARKSNAADLLLSLSGFVLSYGQAESVCGFSRFHVLVLMLMVLVEANFRHGLTVSKEGGGIIDNLRMQG